MAFFINLDKIEITGAPAATPGLPPPRRDYPCSLEIHFDSVESEYFYKFRKTNYVLWHQNDTLTFTLENKAPHLADMWILKHNCTESGSVKLIRLPNLDDEISQADAYADKATSVTMILQVKRNELIHIGLIVVIAPKDGSDAFCLLCDPQVGSGPP
jgi:hypothetical protein